MAEGKISDTRPLAPEPAAISLRVGGEDRSVSYEQAFALGCHLLDKHEVESAARVFEQLQRFHDRGQRAFIMQAFCEAAALHFDRCSKPLAAAFDREKKEVAAELHNAFISYYVGIRQDAIKGLVELVNKHHDLPTLCLLLGNMYSASGNAAMARQCWELAVKRDWPTGGVALAAQRRLQNASTTG